MIAYLGIDPGMSKVSPGAAALVYDGGFKIHDWESTKIAADVLDVWRWEFEIRLACLERIRIFPGRRKGKKVFRSARAINQLPGNAGEWRGILCAYGIDFQEIEPQVWQKILPVARGIDTKARSIMAAKRFFPGCEEFLKFYKHHGRADALCLAKYAMIICG